MNWHDDGPESGPSDDDIAEAQRLHVLHRKSAAEEACLWCREAWPCRHRQWADEIMSAAGDGGQDAAGGATEGEGLSAGGSEDPAAGGGGSAGAAAAPVEPDVAPVEPDAESGEPVAASAESGAGGLGDPPGSEQDAAEDADEDEAFDRHVAGRVNGHRQREA